MTLTRYADLFTTRVAPGLAGFALVSMGLNCLPYFTGEGRLPPYGVTALSPYGSSQQAVSPAPPLQSHIAIEENQ